MTDASNTNTALLVQLLDQVGDLRQEVGKINNQLEHGARRFEEIDEQLTAVQSEQTSMKPVATTVAALEPRVKTMESFMGKKLAPLIAVSSGFIAVILWIITISIGAVGAWVKGQFGSHFHWS